MKVEGITYKSTCSVVLRVEDDYPVFGHLKGIYIVNDSVTLHVRVAETICLMNTTTPTYSWLLKHLKLCLLKDCMILGLCSLHCRKMEVNGQMVIYTLCILM